MLIKIGLDIFPIETSIGKNNTKLSQRVQEIVYFVTTWKSSALRMHENRENQALLRHHITTDMLIQLSNEQPDSSEMFLQQMRNMFLWAFSCCSTTTKNACFILSCCYPEKQAQIKVGIKFQKLVSFWFCLPLLGGAIVPAGLI